jgi:hypothetical protein
MGQSPCYVTPTLLENNFMISKLIFIAISTVMFLGIRSTEGCVHCVAPWADKKPAAITPGVVLSS